MALPPDILGRSPEEAARRIALDRLAGAASARARLEDPDDAHALHDFRVAVRRLRSTLRAWGSPLRRSVRRRDRRTLRAIQTTTGEGRDAEVALQWLEEQRADLKPGQRRGHRWLVDRLVARRERGMRHVRDRVCRDFDAVADDLRERLGRLRVDVKLLEPDARPRFGEVLARKSRKGARRLSRRLGRISGVEDRAACHRARIACKRLRYLVEPLRPQQQEAVAVVRRCKRLQEVLGEMQDAHVLNRELAAALEDASVEHSRRLIEVARGEDAERMRRETRRGERPGLLELTRRVGVRLRDRFEELEKHCLRDGGVRLVEEVEGLARRLETGAATDVEVERTYLAERPDRGPGEE